MRTALNRVFKRDMHEVHIAIHRHRKFQLVITAGVITTTVAATLMPSYNELIVLGSVATNLIWIWE